MSSRPAVEHLGIGWKPLSSAEWLEEVHWRTWRTFPSVLPRVFSCHRKPSAGERGTISCAGVRSSSAARAFRTLAFEEPFILDIKMAEVLRCRGGKPTRCTCAELSSSKSTRIAPVLSLFLPKSNTVLYQCQRLNVGTHLDFSAERKE